jgi:hypothetical protein
MFRVHVLIQGDFMIASDDYLMPESQIFQFFEKRLEVFLFAVLGEVSCVNE